MTRKRLLIDNSYDLLDNSKRICNRKVQNILEERRVQNNTE